MCLLEKKFKQDKSNMNSSGNAHEIIPRLWLGNMTASMEEDFIRGNNIQVVFNCTKNLPFSPMIPIKYRVPVDDNLEEEEIRNMELWSTEIAYKILAEYLKGHTILVHCAAGRQRSAASVAFMLIAYLKLRGSDAMKYIKERRSVAFLPRANFERSIDYFDRKFHGEMLPQMNKIKL
jgi:rhodanese-related sulfurtransferase